MKKLILSSAFIGMALYGYSQTWTPNSGCGRLHNGSILFGVDITSECQISSEKEVNENGINLGEMQGKLLMKIEELTLYIIEQKKQLKELQNRISELENKRGGER